MAVNTIRRYNDNDYTEAAIRFVNGLTTVDSKIGEIRSITSNPDELDYTVNGHVLEKMDEPCWLLGPSGPTFICIENLIPPRFDRTIHSLVKGYFKGFNVDPENVQKILDKIIGINSKKKLAVPFKPHAVCNVTISDEDTGKKSTYQLEIKQVRWETDKDSGKIKSYVLFYNTAKRSTIKLSVTEYMKSFRLSDLSVVHSSDKSNDIDLSVINMTDLGAIRPIEFTDGNLGLVVDGTFVYEVTDLDTNIVGHWDTEKGDYILYKKSTAKIYRAFKNSLSIIRAHRKMIAPYMSLDTNKVNVKAK